MRSIVYSLMIISLLVGCINQGSPLAADNDAPGFATLTSSLVVPLIKAVDQPVIVEFSVLHGGVRCAEMRPKVEKLASKQAPLRILPQQLLPAFTDT